MLGCIDDAGPGRKSEPVIYVLNRKLLSVLETFGSSIR